ncbi:MAG: chorismate mutase, partial [Planctomycetes bacterium]|nr:chorismate mutase [Planctomycetota bacterium]
MSDLDRGLDAIRVDLDQIDDQLVRLISERARLAQRIGEVKAAAGMRVYVPDRERKVLDRVCALNEGPLDDRALRSIYRELMSASLALERSPRIALLGPPGSF